MAREQASVHEAAAAAASAAEVKTQTVGEQVQGTTVAAATDSTGAVAPAAPAAASDEAGAAGAGADKPLWLSGPLPEPPLPLERIYLAPMEGVCDPLMREVMTRHGAYDECFSEFIRVTTEVLPYKTLKREVPELEKGGCTDAGCLCRVQLLGDEPEPLAQTALRAVELGARSLDLNFGCPSRFVHHGGAMLLKEPELLNRIVSRVREVLPPEIFLSVKFRLGFLSAAELPEIVRALAVDGVGELIIHGRTRKDLYRSEALNWPAIAVAHEYCRGIPVVANGDIVDYASSQRCAFITKTSRQMIGRAVFATPNLPQVMRGEGRIEPLPLSKVLDIAWEFGQEMIAHDFPEKSVMDRLKQFLGYAHKYNHQLTDFFRVFCRSQTLHEAQQLLDSQKCELC